MSDNKKTVKDLKWINNGSINKRVKQDQLDSYLKSGWSLGFLSGQEAKRWVHKDNKNFVIKKSELDDYLNNGYLLGKLSSEKERNRVVVHKDNISKRIQKSDVDKYLSDGWSLGVHYNYRWINNLVEEKYTDEELTSGWYLGRLINNPNSKVSMYNEDEIITVDKYLISEYKAKGYLLGKGKKVGLCKGSTKDRVWVNNGSINKLVTKEELDDYLNNGFVKGNFKIKNLIYVNKNGISKGIKQSDLQYYLDDGYDIGVACQNHMLGKRWVMKDDLFKAVTADELSEYLEDGWVFGRPIKASKDKVWVNRDGLETTYIDLDKLPEYLNNGWHSGRLTDSNKFYITNESEDRLVDLDEYNLYYRNKSNWRIGTKNHGCSSTVEVEFSNILDNNNIEYEQQFHINYNSKSYYYDFKVGNILIELNPSVTHNSTWSPYSTPKTKDYHYLKSLAARESGYRCICIWDWDNIDILINLLKSKESIYARKCKIRSVCVKDAKSFIDNNHFQGYAKDSIRIGLYYNDKLVSIMTFGKPRYNKKYEYELIRYCSLYNVTGGSEKLLKYFINNYKPSSIISYCDLSKFSGYVYEKLGFKYKNYSIGKHWYNIRDKRHITDNLLRQQGFDRLFNTSYGKGTSNEDLIKDYNYLEIYDCGQAVYVWGSDVLSENSTN